MLRATSVVAAGDAMAGTDSVELDYDERHRRRYVMTSSGGVEFLLDLPNAVALQDGDVLVLEQGVKIVVRAKPERLAVVTGSDPRHLARLAWHLGNRHLPTEVRGDSLRFRNDHVMVEMIRGLGGKVDFVTEPFQPEHGAYDISHDHE